MYREIPFLSPTDSCPATLLDIQRVRYARLQNVICLVPGDTLHSTTLCSLFFFFLVLLSKVELRLVIEELYELHSQHPYRQPVTVNAVYRYHYRYRFSTTRIPFHLCILISFSPSVLLALRAHRDAERVEKMAAYVCRNGGNFEEMIREREKDNPLLSFIFGGDLHE